MLGAGSWGTALSILLARNGHEVVLWGRDEEEMGVMRATRENLHYLPGFVLPEEIRPVSEADELGPADFWLVAIPSPGVRECLELVRGENPMIVIASKGLEPGSADLLETVAGEVVRNSRRVVLSGPNLAVEIVRGIPTAAVAASANEHDADIIRQVFSCRSFGPPNWCT